MSDKPSYLGLLNAIAVGEGRGYQLLSTWAECTADAELANVLSVIALREQEHAASFEKRICELGFSVRRKDDPAFEIRLEEAGSAKSDRKKFKKVLGIRKKNAASAEQPDQFTDLFNDPSIDIQTGALLGRFIAEERDSGRRLRDAYHSLNGRAESQPSAEVRELEAICARLDALTETIDGLKAARSSKSAGTSSKSAGR
jgi:rubrerythrin